MYSHYRIAPCTECTLKGKPVCRWLLRQCYLSGRRRSKSLMWAHVHWVTIRGMAELLNFQLIAKFWKCANYESFAKVRFLGSECTLYSDGLYLLHEIGRIVQFTFKKELKLSNRDWILPNSELHYNEKSKDACKIESLNPMKYSFPLI